MIKNTLGLTALVGAMTCSTAALAAPSFPIHDGNVWVFDSSVEGDSMTISMSDYELDAWGYEAVTVKGLYRSETTVEGDWLYDWYDFTWAYSTDYGYTTAFDFWAWSGDSWNTELSACESYTVTAESTTADVETFAGVFSAYDVATFDLNGYTAPNVRCMVPPSMDNAQFAWGVGPVHVDKVDGSHDLLIARVDGDIIGNGSIVDDATARQALAIDAPSYSHEQIWCFTTPCHPIAATLSAALVFTNTSDDALDLSYSNGQKFDLDILDASGNNVRSWSDDQFFTQATELTRVWSGGSLSYYADLPLADRNGIALPAGEYALVGYIKGSDNGQGFTKMEAFFTVN